METENRTCSRCGETKHEKLFYGHSNVCSECRREEYRNKRIKEVDIYWPDHEPGICVYCGATYKEKKFGFEHGKHRKICNSCRWKRQKEKYGEKNNEHRRIKEKTDPRTKINKLMRNGIKKTLVANNIKKNRRTWTSLVDYDADDLYKHLKKSLRKLNKERGTKYTWDDFLNASLHIDHITPINAFDYDSADHPDFKRCWSLENLQLLPAFDNMSKSDKYDSFQIAF